MTQLPVLGLDMSYSRSGLVLIDQDFQVVHSGTLTFKKGDKRLLRALKAISRFLVELPIKPGLAVIEDGFFAGSQKVTRMLRELNATTKIACELAQIPWVEISSTKVKKAIADRGDAEKHQVAEAIERKYGIRFPGDDENGFDLSDAAALAVFGLTEGGRKR